MHNLCAVSLFSSAGIGDLGLQAAGISVLTANEIIEDRAKLYKENFPSTEMIVGDIWDNREIITNSAQKQLGSEKLWMVYATPPCQGMSTNGVGKLRAEIAAGNRPPEDERNRLVIPALDVIEDLQPEWVIFENVPNMENTIIRTEEGYQNIISYIGNRLGDHYVGCAEVVDCSHYSIPQVRKRLITIFTKSESGISYFESNNGTFFPTDERSHQVTLRDAIGNFPPLEGVEGSESNTDFHPFHYVRIMTPEKHWWMKNTPEGETAFNNQCVNKDCLFDQNIRHKDSEINGSWDSRNSTPIYCSECGELLPRPNMIDLQTGKRRVISGFHSAYRRMRWDEPSKALTRNLFFESSDNKVHPEQSRVLSIYEALVVQTISEYQYSWDIDGVQVPRRTIANCIGESVPPKLIEQIMRKFTKIDAISTLSVRQ